MSLLLEVQRVKENHPYEEDLIKERTSYEELKEKYTHLYRIFLELEEEVRRPRIPKKEILRLDAQRRHFNA